ncbi:ABC transporter substrate-binding protein [Roseomonas sp. BN140053]|uniref:ABC transporter substrate-binding protein n=1 Tax=Roseomonas sp. BN140053 TaxID=3391898 RepID=UPI0039EAD68C
MTIRPHAAAPAARSAAALAAGFGVALAAVPFVAQAQAPAGNLRVAIYGDPDIMDPTLARSLVGRIVFAGLCDKLFDISDKLEVVPQLATGYRWEDPRTLILTLRPNVKFHDGEPMDAEAVRYSLNRHMTMQGSFRRSEIGIMQAVEVVDPLTVRIRLQAPSAPFLSQLADRAGIIVSPKAAEAGGRDFGMRPVCAGPFRWVERVAQDHITLQRFPDYWDAGRIHLERVTYQVITDSSVRSANLRSGAVDITHDIAPSDVAEVRAARNMRVVANDALGYWGLTINMNNGPRAQTPMGQDPRVREALEIAIDREALIQVVFDGAFAPATQSVGPESPFFAPEIPLPRRDPERAKQLLREAGVPIPFPVEVMVANVPEQRQAVEVMQAMAAEAGFALRINAVEFASGLQAAARGDFQLYLSGWSGRPDADGNIYAFLHSTGGQNDNKYSNPEVDRLIEAARVEPDVAKRRELYGRMWQIALRQDHSRLYLWHIRNIAAMNTRVQNFRPHPDGLIRLQDLRLQ